MSKRSPSGRLATRHERRLVIPPVRDRGVTLIEILVTIVLTGTIVIAIMAAIRTSIVASSTVYEAAELETVLLNATDRVDRAPQLCNYEQYVDAAALAAGWTANETTVTVEHLVSNTGNPATDWAPQPCPDDVQPFDVQRLVVTASTPDGSITRKITMVKSDVD